MRMTSVQTRLLHRVMIAVKVSLPRFILGGLTCSHSGPHAGTSFMERAPNPGMIEGTWIRSIAN
jgi:hypothetical protein